MSEKVKKKRAVKKKDKYLVIVESPAKSKTINKILGSQYKVIASMGHMFDLPQGRMGVDFDNDFKPHYIAIRGRGKYLKSIKSEAKAAKSIFLAADPDREGEAICWHLRNELSKYCNDIKRVRFEEITAKAIKDAFDKSGELDMDKVNAQQARRILDRIVGYSLSPLLWGKISRGLSAGRVQSVAVRLIVERENEIKKFKPEEFWSIDALLEKIKAPKKDNNQFKAKLIKHKGEKVHIRSKEEAEKMLDDIKTHDFIVTDVSRKEKRSYPRSPYTTSLLQQDAFNKLNFSASKTMMIAQKLYEGIDLGAEESVGLITYMRTDSVRISNDARDEAKKLIISKYGEKYYPEIPHEYKSRKMAQEAHEAIRPTLPLRHPKTVAGYLTKDEYKLYEFIWNRFITSQMSNAIYSILSVNIDAGEYRFKAGGGDLIFDGFLRVYEGLEKVDEELENIPPLEKNEKVNLTKLLPEQHFTKAPPRYSDASLVKVLEEKGIGRPSTYAPIIRTIIDRHYVQRVRRYFYPTELGELVNTLLVDNFPDIVDYEFTARLEGELDNVEEGKNGWVNVLKEFYGPFTKKLEDAKDRMKHVNKHDMETGDSCALCGRPMVIKWGRRGKFISCSGFPECRNSKSITTGVKCPNEGCDGELIERKSFRGKFYGCSKFPKCTFTSKTLPGQNVEASRDENEIEDN